MKMTSRVPILVLVAVPLPRFVRPSLMLLVVEVMVESSRPVCSLSAACNELTSPDSTAVFSFSNPAGLCTELIKLVMVELSNFKPSRMVVSNALGSPPSSAERPSRDVMLPFCLSKKDPACFHSLNNQPALKWLEVVAFCRTLPTLPALPGSGSASGSGCPPSPCGRPSACWIHKTIAKAKKIFWDIFAFSNLL